MTASATAETTAKTTNCTARELVNRLTSSAAAAPTANHTDTSAVVAASTAPNAAVAMSQKILSIGVASFLTIPPSGGAVWILIIF